jgi:ribosomal protein S18 acetylase RimI-like enzyme
MNAVLDRPARAVVLSEADFQVLDSLAQCSLWWRRTPELPPYKIGCIGRLSASPGGPIAPILSLACDYLLRRGCSLAIGPMDSSTWGSYRLVTESLPIVAPSDHAMAVSGRPAPFFLEVTNPPEWKQEFLQAGFHEIASYCSSMVPDLTNGCRDITPRQAQLAQRGIRIRPFDRDRFDSELYTIYRIASEAFLNNFLYSPISWQEFALLYYPLREVVNPDFVLVAEVEGQPAGFIFALPDLLQGRSDAQFDTVIIKSLGVVPAYKGVGLGSLLVDRVHRSAMTQGYQRAIHALMRDDNQAARQISAHTAHVFRRYRLFARHLQGSS